ncbi:MAG: hypothetical protein KDK78_00170 [Chlamydiia bacterium]|nr:hypothetical protein [Chlamydiia bacterium]
MIQALPLPFVPCQDPKAIAEEWLSALSDRICGVVNRVFDFFKDQHTRVLDASCQMKIACTRLYQRWIAPPQIGLKVLSPGHFSALHPYLTRIDAFLRAGCQPFAPQASCSGSYLFPDIGIFKPVDEEAFAPNNPKRFVGKLGQSGMRHGIAVGTSMQRECLAYAMDHGHFAGVPLTVEAELTHPCLFDAVEGHRGQQRYTKSKTGSFQVFVPHTAAVQELTQAEKRKIPAHEVHKIAILDIRTCNADRHLNNILATKTEDAWKLTPIDHGLIMPEKLSQLRFRWVKLDQADEPLCEKCIDYIHAIDLDADARIQEQAGMSKTAQRVSRWATTWMKKAVDAGWTLGRIGTFMERKKGLKREPSAFERLIKQAERAGVLAGLVKDATDTAYCETPEFEALLFRLMDEAVLRPSNKPSALPSSGPASAPDVL